MTPEQIQTHLDILPEHWEYAPEGDPRTETWCDDGWDGGCMFFRKDGKARIYLNEEAPPLYAIDVLGEGDCADTFAEALQVADIRIRQRSTKEFA